jgi:hypothetical protein
MNAGLVSHVEDYSPSYVCLTDADWMTRFYR